MLSDGRRYPRRLFTPHLVMPYQTNSMFSVRVVERPQGTLEGVGGTLGGYHLAVWLTSSSKAQPPALSTPALPVPPGLPPILLAPSARRSSPNRPKLLSNDPPHPKLVDHMLTTEVRGGYAHNSRLSEQDSQNKTLRARPNIHDLDSRPRPTT